MPARKNTVAEVEPVELAEVEPVELAEVTQAAPSAMGSTFAERRAARLGLPMPNPVQPTPTSSTFAERKVARLKAIQDAENKAIDGAETK